MRLLRVLNTIIISVCIISIGVCLQCSEKLAGSEVTNEKYQGTVYLPGGKIPAQGAHILIVPADYVPPTVGLDKRSNTNATIIRTTTDNDGHYSLQGITNNSETGNNFYNVLADLDTLGLLRDSIQLPLSINQMITDTLRNSSSLSGIVRLQPNHDVSTVVVQAVGTNIFVNVNSQGKFTIPKIAMGDYRLKISTYLPDYVPAYVPVLVNKQHPDTLKDTIRLHYSGIPIVSGILASYDSLSGIVHLHWNATDFMDLADYVIFKDPYDSIQLSNKPIAATQDTFFNDNLLPSNFEAGILRYKYRVAVRNNSFTMGLTYKYVSVSAMSQGKLSVTISDDTGISFNKNGALFANIKSPTSPIKTIQWRQVLPKDSLCRSTSFTKGYFSLTDSLSIIATNLYSGSTYLFYCIVTDFVGAKVMDSITIWRYDVTPIDTSLPIPGTISSVNIHTQNYKDTVLRDSTTLILADLSGSFTSPTRFSWYTNISDTLSLFSTRTSYNRSDSISFKSNTAGIKTIICKASDSSNIIRSDTLYLTVLPPPVLGKKLGKQNVSTMSASMPLQSAILRKDEVLLQ